MRGMRQENGARPNHDQRRERPHRAAKSRPWSLRASGVTPASCCWNAQLVFWPRACDGPKSLSDTKSDNLYVEKENGNCHF
jgi:hypothetical protein